MGVSWSFPQEKFRCIFVFAATFLMPVKHENAFAINMAISPLRCSGPFCSDLVAFHLAFKRRRRQQPSAGV